MLSTSGHVGFISHWAVPIILLAIAILSTLYGRHEIRHEDGSPMLALSAYMIAMILSVVSIAYVAMLPIMIIMKHSSMNMWIDMEIIMVMTVSIILTWLSLSGIKFSLESF